MYKLEPIALIADNDIYKVRFRRDAEEVTFIFKVDEKPFVTLGWETEFSALVNGDPAALVLNSAIFDFHEVRNCSKLRAIALIADSKDSYIFRFQSEGGELEYIFTIENFESVKFDERLTIQNLGDSVKLDSRFLEVISDDATVYRLQRAICYFHEARYFQYEPEPSQSI